MNQVPRRDLTFPRNNGFACAEVQPCLRCGSAMAGKASGLENRQYVRFKPGCVRTMGRLHPCKHDNAYRQDPMLHKASN